MNIKQITFPILATFIVAVTASVQAETVFDFGPASYCPTYCNGFTTDNPTFSVDFITPRYNNTTIVSVNGVVYRGPMAWVAIGTNGTHTVHRESNVVLSAADGRYIIATITEDYWVTVVNSGRAHGYLPHNFVTGGTITIP